MSGGDAGLAKSGVEKAGAAGPGRHAAVRPHPLRWLRDGTSPDARRRIPLCPELDCIRNRLPPGLLAAAELRSGELGVGAERVLITQGHIDEESYVRALAAALRMDFERLEGPRALCPLSDRELLLGARTGMLRLGPEAGVALVAPVMLGSRWLVRAMRVKSDLSDKVVLTTQARLRAFATEHGADALAVVAADGLRTEHPQLSAAPLGASKRKPSSWLAAAVIGALGITMMAGGFGSLLAGLIEAALLLVIIAWTALRVIGLLNGERQRKPPRLWSDAALPTYTVIAALHREAAALPGLVKALAAFDYPALGSKRTYWDEDVSVRGWYPVPVGGGWEEEGGG